MDIGTAIWTARKAQGITQEELAEMVNITTSHLKHIESGHRKPSVEVLFQITKILNLSLDALIFDNEAKIPAIQTQGLTTKEVGIISQLVDALRDRGNSN